MLICSTVNTYPKCVCLVGLYDNLLNTFHCPKSLPSSTESAKARTTTTNLCHAIVDKLERNLKRKSFNTTATTYITITNTTTTTSLCYAIMDKLERNLESKVFVILS